MEMEAFWSNGIIYGDNGAWLHRAEGRWEPGPDLSHHSVKRFHLVYFLWLPLLSTCCLCSCLFSDTEPVSSRMLWINNEGFFCFFFCFVKSRKWHEGGLNTSFPVHFLSVSICNSTSSRIYAEKKKKKKEMPLLRPAVWVHNLQHICIRGSTVTTHS